MTLRTLPYDGDAGMARKPHLTAGPDEPEFVFGPPVLFGLVLPDTHNNIIFIFLNLNNFCKSS